MIKFILRFDGKIDEFYRLGGITLFLDRMSNFLTISSYRLKTLAVRNGSIIIDFVVLEPSYYTGKDLNLNLNASTTEFLKMVLKIKESVGLRSIGLPWPVIFSFLPVFI